MSSVPQHQHGTGVDFLNRTSELVLEAGLSGGLGYIASRAFMLVNPVHGAVYCAVSTVVSKIFDIFLSGLLNQNGINNSTRFLFRAINLAACTAISATIATAIGFPIAFEAALILTGASFLAVALVVAFFGITTLMTNS